MTGDMRFTSSHNLISPQSYILSSVFHTLIKTRDIQPRKETISHHQKALYLTIKVFLPGKTEKFYVKEKVLNPQLAQQWIDVFCVLEDEFFKKGIKVGLNEKIGSLFQVLECL